jgi:predicted TPR repeat methyltransferase
MNDNATTLNSYNDHLQEYLDSMSPTMNEYIKEWLKRVLALIPKGSPILELGTGAGRDAEYIESLGYKVMRTDAAKGFVELMRQQGYEARVLDALTDDYGTDLAMIFANAVLLHFDPGQTTQVLKKAQTSLMPGGLFVFSVKQGTGEEWSKDKIDAPRYFYYWRPEELKKILAETGFETLELAEGKSRRATWFYVTLRKPTVD